MFSAPKYPYHANYGPDVPPMKGERVLGHWMIMFRLATQMLDKKPDPEIESSAGRCVDAIMNYHYNPEFDLKYELRH